MNIKELDLNKYNEKSKLFANQILKYYPMKKDWQNNIKQHYQPYMHMHDHRKERQIFDRSTAQKLQNMTTFKQEGNQYFSQSNYSQAAYYYNKIIIYGDYTFPQTDEEKNKMDSLIQVGNMNLALSLIKMNNWEVSKPTSLQVILNQAINGPNDKQTLKAYYWLIKYYIKKGDYEKSKQNLNLLKNKNQNVKKQLKTAEQTLIQLQQLINKQQTKSLKQSKGLFSQMFSK